MWRKRRQMTDEEIDYLIDDVDRSLKEYQFLLSDLKMQKLISVDQLEMSLMREIDLLAALKVRLKKKRVDILELEKYIFNFKKLCMWYEGDSKKLIDHCYSEGLVCRLIEYLDKSLEIFHKKGLKKKGAAYSFLNQLREIRLKQIDAGERYIVYFNDENSREKAKYLIAYAGNI